MMRRFFPTLVLAAAVGLAACEQPTTTDVATPQFGTEKTYIVIYNDDVANVGETTQDLAVRGPGVFGFSSEDIVSVRHVAAPGFAATMSPAAADALRRDSRVKLVIEDRPISLPPVMMAPPCGTPNGGECPPDDGGDDGGTGGDVIPWGVDRVGGPADGTGRTAWVIDSGVDLDHPDLNVDLSCSANFVTRGKDSPDDGNGHGTHVAGTIGALSNGSGVVGVAAGARICAVRVLDNSGSGTWSGVMAGVDFVAANGSNGDVANMSLGGTASDSEPNALEQAILDAAGTVKFAIAAGNSGEDANNHTPARIGDNSSSVYTISATDQSDCLTSWSNYGSAVDFAEPGASILSTAKGGGTTTMSGTSMASPHMAGILLLGSPANGGSACGDPDGSGDTIGTL